MTVRSPGPGPHAEISLLRSPGRERPLFQPGRQPMVAIMVGTALVGIMAIDGLETRDGLRPTLRASTKLTAPPANRDRLAFASAASPPRRTEESPPPTDTRKVFPVRREQVVRPARQPDSRPLASASPWMMSPALAKMVDGEDLSIEVEFPDITNWQAAFRAYHGNIGISMSNLPRPQYFDWSLTPFGQFSGEHNPTKGLFLFRLDPDAVAVVNKTLESHRIPDDAAVFGVFPMELKSRIGKTLEDFASAQRMNVRDLDAVKLSISGPQGLRVVSHSRK
jgi:hypothetical protein